MADSPVRVKICGLRTPGDARIAAGAGADLVGCVLVQGSPREVTPRTARTIADAADLPLVLVVADRDIDWLEDAAGESGAAILQLHGTESPEFVAAVAGRGPWTVWKGVRTPDAATARDAMARFGSVAAGLLLDGFRAGELGGTGVSFDWEGVAPLRRVWPPGCLFIAAGGLNPENVERAVSILRPDIVDVSSGVESAPGVKDPRRIRDFVRRAGVVPRDS